MTLTAGTRAGILPGVANFRDVGGLPTRSGDRVRTGLLYRSTELSVLSTADAVILRRLGIRTVYDLRTAPERAGQPEADRLPAGTDHVVVDLLGDSAGATPATFARMLADPVAAGEALRGDRGVAMFERRYRDFVSLPSAVAGYGRLFRELADGAVLPAIIHCTTGKDRTGWAVVILQTVLEVPGEEIARDYLASNAAMEPLMRPQLDAFAARGGDASLLEPLAGVRPSYLASAYAEVDAAFGSMERYLADGLGLDPACQARLRAVFVEPA